MSLDNYNQLLIGGIILGSIIFFSNHLSSYSQELPLKTGDASGETPDIIIPSPIFSGQELGEQKEPSMTSQQDQKQEKGIEIQDQQEDIGQEIEEEFEKDDTGISTSNIIEEEKEEEQDNEKDNTDVPFVLPFP